MNYKSTYDDITITRRTPHGVKEAWIELAFAEDDVLRQEYYFQQAEHWRRQSGKVSR